MGRRLLPEHVALYKKIDEILWNDGKFLGTAVSPEGREEYFACLPQVFRMTVEGSSCSAIADYLQSIAKRHQGASFDALQCTTLAAHIVEQKKGRRL